MAGFHLKISIFDEIRIFVINQILTEVSTIKVDGFDDVVFFCCKSDQSNR